MSQSMIEELPGTMGDELSKSILHEPVSSVVRLIEWNPSDQALRVTLTTGAVYDYPGVSRQRVQDFMDAPSKGAHFNEHFRMRMTLDQKRESFLFGAPITARGLRRFAEKQTEPHQMDAKALALEAAEALERALVLVRDQK